MPGPPKGQSIRSAHQRFVEKYKVSDDGCWIWQANRNNRGYGTFYYHGLMMLAHRASYIMHRGPIPSGLIVDHLCNTPHCVNPDHLQVTTQRHNVRRAVADKSHCVNGHPLEGDNVGIRSDSGWRFCRTCKRQCDAMYRRRREVVS